MQLLGNWRRLLLLGDGHPVCLSMACRIYRVSRSRLYPEHSTRTKAESNHNRAVVATSVSSWFESFKQVLDVFQEIHRVPVNGIPNRVECVKTNPQAKQGVWCAGVVCRCTEAHKPLFDDSLTATELRMQLLGNWRRVTVAW